MSESETENLKEHVIHHSLLLLLIKGGIAWAILTFFDYLIDLLPNAAIWINTHTTTFSINVQSITSSAPLNHFIINILYGWLVLYVVLSWVFNYYIVKKDVIFIRNGIIFSHEYTYQIADIKGITIQQGILAKILNTGSIKLNIFRVEKEIILFNIDNPKEIALHIEHQRAKIENPNYQSTQETNGNMHKL